MECSKLIWIKVNLCAREIFKTKISHYCLPLSQTLKVNCAMLNRRLQLCPHVPTESCISYLIFLIHSSLGLTIVWYFFFGINLNKKDGSMHPQHLGVGGPPKWGWENSKANRKLLSRAYMKTYFHPNGCYFAIRQLKHIVHSHILVRGTSKQWVSTLVATNGFHWLNQL